MADKNKVKNLSESNIDGVVNEVSMGNNSSNLDNKLKDEIEDNAIEELMILKQTIEEKNELIEKLKKESEENKELLIRLKADFENYKKRVREEQKDMVKFSNQKLISDLIPILDDLDRAIDSSSDEIKKTAFFEGLNMVIKSFHNILEKNYYLEKIEKENVIFDPHFHEAISVAEDPDIEGMIVSKVLQKGYKIDSRVLRTAKVVVKKGVEKKDTNKEDKNKEEHKCIDKLDLKEDITSDKDESNKKKSKDENTTNNAEEGLNNKELQNDDSDDNK